MRLFQTGGFYLHDSPRLSAEWLTDKDTIGYVRNTSVLISTALQLHICERDPKLNTPDFSIIEDCYDVLEWLQASRHSLAWMLDYYDAIVTKANRVFKHAPYTWEYRRHLTTYLALLDDCDVNPREWLPLPPSQARQEYINEVKSYSYRKVPAPYWFPAGRKSATLHQDRPADELYVPDYDLSPLE